MRLWIWSLCSMDVAMVLCGLLVRQVMKDEIMNDY